MNQIYCGPPPVPAELALRWNLDPVLLAVLSGLALGAWTLRSRLGRSERRAAMGALLALMVAFVSPLCALSSALFSARVVHHLLLVLVAAPLLAVAWPSTRAARRTSVAVPALVLSSALLWLWHVPALYDRALSDVAVYWAMQTSLLAAFVMYWRAVLSPSLPPPQAAAFVIAGFAQMGLLGALLTFAPRTLYAAHEYAPLAWGLAPLADQQLGGLTMWVPAAIPYATMLWIVARDGWSRLLRQAA